MENYAALLNETGQKRHARVLEEQAREIRMANAWEAPSAAGSAEAPR
jgi:hypothetical protein